MPEHTRDILMRLAEDFEGQSEALLRLSGEVRTPVVAAVLAGIGHILSTIGVACDECAHEGTHAPMEDLAGRAVDWLGEVVCYVPTQDDADAAQLARLLDDGCPNAIVEAH